MASDEDFDQSMSLAVEAIYDASLDSSKWAVAIKAFGEAMQGSAIFVVFDKRIQKTPLMISQGFDPDHLRDFTRHFANLNPYPAAGLQRATGTVLWAHDLIDPDTVRRTEYYNDFMRPAGVSVSFPGVKLVERDDQFAAIAANPVSSILEQNPTAVARRIGILAKHVQRALEINRRVLTSENVADAFGAGLGSIKIAAFVLDRQRRILEANAPAEQLLHYAGVLKAEPSGFLRAERSSEEAELARSFNIAGTHGANIIRLSSRKSQDRFLACRLALDGADSAIQSARHDSMQSFLVRAWSLLLVWRIEGAPQIPAEIIRSAMDVTLAEAKLIRALVSGSTLADYAEQSGLSVRTARNQLASVFVRTHTTRQADLVALVIRMLGPFGSV